MGIQGLRSRTAGTSLDRAVEGMQIHLRLLDNIENETLVGHLPIKFSGTYEECNSWAAQNGWTWRRSKNVFGGYFVAQNGDCLLPT